MIISQKTVNRIVTFIFILLTLQYTAFYYVDEGILPTVSLYVFYLAAILLPMVISQKATIKWTPYRLLFVLSFAIIFLISIILKEGDPGEMIANFFIYLSILTAFWFSTLKIEIIFRILKRLTIIGIIAFVYIMAVSNIDLATALKRGYTWTEIFFYAPIFWAVIPVVILSFLYEKYLTLVLIYWGCAIVLNLLFLKRAILVDSLLLMLAILFINYHKEKKLVSGVKLFFIATIIIGGSLYFFSNAIISLFDATNQRMESTSEDLSTFDRFIESKNYFGQATFSEVLVGAGFSGQHDGLGKTSNALHVGWSNFLFKGGFLLILIILIPYLKILGLIKRFKSLPLDIQFSILFLLINIPRLMYINTHNLSPYMLLLFYSFFKIMDFKKNKITHYR